MANANIFTIMKGADTPPIKARLKAKDGTTTTLTGATVEFIMWNKVTGVTVSLAGTASILSATPPVDPDEPNVQYDWDAADTANPGIYFAYWKVTYASGDIEFYPDDQPYNEVQIGRGPSS